MGTLQELVMAQTEKYMLLETKAIQQQKIASTEAMLLSALGRTEKSPLGVPLEPTRREPPMAIDEAIAYATAHSPVITGKQRMIDAAEAKIAMAEKEYYPDFTVTGGVSDKGS